MPASPSATSGSTCPVCAAMMSNVCVYGVCGRSYLVPSLVRAGQPSGVFSVVLTSKFNVVRTGPEMWESERGKGKERLPLTTWIGRECDEMSRYSWSVVNRFVLPKCYDIAVDITLCPVPRLGSLQF